MRQWRRRNRNTFARGPGGKSAGRRYADQLSQEVNNAFDAIVTYHQAREFYKRGGGSTHRVDRAELALTQAINLLKL